MATAYMLPFLSPRDAGRVLGVSTSRVKQLSKKGVLPEYRDSAGRRLYDPRDVEHLKQKREAAKVA